MTLWSRLYFFLWMMFAVCASSLIRQSKNILVTEQTTKTSLQDSKSRLSAAAPDPCVSYIDLNDITTNNTQSGSNTGFLKPGWYRATQSTEGSLIQTCPTGTECGTTSQAWMNDTIQPFPSEEQLVTICIKRGDNCCDRSHDIRLKNCGNFVVYYLLPLPAYVGYCFDSTSISLNPVNTTSIVSFPTFIEQSTTSTLTSVKTTENTKYAQFTSAQATTERTEVPKSTAYPSRSTTKVVTSTLSVGQTSVSSARSSTIEKYPLSYISIVLLMLYMKHPGV